MTANADRFTFASTIAREAGAVALGYFANLESLTVRSKGVQDMATEADVNTEKVIRNAIVENYPGDGFLGEESCETFKPDASVGTWIVDPIDGTQPFLCGMRSWCISIAYFEQGELQLGVVYDPSADELFAAQKGQGATLNGRPMFTAPASNVADGLVSIGYSNRVRPEATLGPLTRLLHADGMYHRSGSGALSLAYVAAGRLIGYFEPHMCAWDLSAGALLVREAGGRTNDCLPGIEALVTGSPMIAATSGVYEQLLAIING